LSNLYQKPVKIIGIVAAVLFPVALVLSFCFNFLFYAIIIYATIILSLIGYLGGIWLWKYLATSELIKGNMKRTIKLFGIVVLIGFIAFISFSLYIAFFGDPSVIQSIVSIANYVILFMVVYCIGYLASIWRISSPASESNNANLGKAFQLDWAIIKRVLKLAIPCGAVIGVITVILGIYLGQLPSALFYYGIIVLLLGGLCLGYLIWEHLKKSNLITGDFQKQLKYVSIVFTVALGALALYGLLITFSIPFNIQFYRDLILFYVICIICLFFYFLGLYVSIITSK